MADSDGSDLYPQRRSPPIPGVTFATAPQAADTTPINAPSTMPLSPADRDAVIRTTLGEAGVDPDSQPGVASVVLNRMRNSGLSAIQTVMAPNQFEAWSARPQELRSYSPSSPQYQAVGQMVDSLASGQMPDPTAGAVRYYAPAAQAALGRAPPAWDDGTGMMLGAHKFFGGQQVAMSDGDIASMYAGAKAAPRPMADSDIGSMWQGPASKSAAPGMPPAPATSPNPYGALPPASTLASPQNQAAPQPPLSNAPSDSYASGMLKGAATGAIRGVGDALGVFGNVSDAAGLITDGVQALVTGRPFSQVQQENAATLARVKAIQAQSPLGQVTSALNPQNRLPDGASFYNPVLAQTGAYAPTTLLGQMAQGGLQAAVGGAPLAGTNALSPVALAASGGMGAISTGIADKTGSPFAGMAAGLAIPSAIGAASRAPAVLAGRVAPSTAALADMAMTKYGIPLGLGQISDNPGVRFAGSTVNRLPMSGADGALAAQQGAFNRAVSATIGENAPKLTPDVMLSARTRIGQVFEDVGNRTNVAADPQFQNDLQNVLLSASKELSDQEMKPLSASFDNIMDKVQGGTIPGDAYNALRRTGSPLDRATDNQSSGTAYFARQIRDVLDDAFQRSASPDDQAALSQARAQWANLKTLQPLAAKATTGDISPGLLMGRVNANTGNALAFGGGGDLGDLARVGTKFMKDMPSSGTAERGSTVAGLNSLAQAALYGGAAFGAKDLLGQLVPNASPAELAMSAASVPATLALGRGVGAVLRSNALARAVVARSLGRSQPGLGSALFQGSVPAGLATAGNALSGR